VRGTERKKKKIEGNDGILLCSRKKGTVREKKKGRPPLPANGIEGKGKEKKDPRKPTAGSRIASFALERTRATLILPGGKEGRRETCSPRGRKKGEKGKRLQKISQRKWMRSASQGGKKEILHT